MAVAAVKAKASPNGTLHNRIKDRLQPVWRMPQMDEPWPFPVTVEPTTGWGVSVGDITPALASKMLACNAENQRSRRPHYIARLSADMTAGRWVMTPEAAIFNQKGELVDGQNRLACVVETGATIRLMVWFGVGGKKEMIALNSGAQRSSVDAAKVLGISGISASANATLRSFLTGPTTVREPLTNGRIIELFRQYEPMVAFVHGLNVGSMGKLFTGPVRGAVGRAFYHCPPEKLRRFVSILCDVEAAAEPADKAVVMLRILQFNGRGAGGNGALKAELYKKTQRSILAFVNGERLTKLYAAEEDLFPMPTAAQMKARA